MPARREAVATPTHPAQHLQHQASPQASEVAEVVPEAWKG